MTSLLMDGISNVSADVVFLSFCLALLIGMLLRLSNSSSQNGVSQHVCEKTTRTKPCFFHRRHKNCTTREEKLRVGSNLDGLSGSGFWIPIGPKKCVCSILLNA